MLTGLGALFLSRVTGDVGMNSEIKVNKAAATVTSKLQESQEDELPAE